jgi:uncharacterized protein with NRDE domain
MCTVSFLPLDRGDFILTSNRDERVARQALDPELYDVHGQWILYPKDPEAGGTWIATSQHLTACLLNGAFEKHQHQPPYRKSRGLVLLDAFAYEDPEDFAYRYSFEGIEPFTLVLIQEENLFELRWDGQQLMHTPLPVHEPKIWASVTLYSAETIQKRKDWFEEWTAKNPEPTVEEIRKFHRFAGDGDKANDLLMNRNDFLKTTSITTVSRLRRRNQMIYENLITNAVVQVNAI